MERNAKLYFYYGAMGCGKSLKLLTVAHNYDKISKQIIVTKPCVDTRNGDLIFTRLENNQGENIIQRKVDLLIKKEDSSLKELKALITNNTDAILIDEAQFLTEEQVFELFKLVKLENIPVLTFGLITNFQGKLFAGSEALVCYSDEKIELASMCDCGKKARFNARKVNGDYTLTGDSVAIEGENNTSYEGVCGACYLQKVHQLIKK